MRDELGLHPGSRPPDGPEEVEALLRRVPELAFVPELEPCVPHTPPGVAWPPSPADLVAGADAEFLARVLTGLSALAERAERERNGGLAALIRILTYFLHGDAALPAGEHPLLVALLLRGAARAQGRPDAAAEIARAMDLWG